MKFNILYINTIILDISHATKIIQNERLNFFKHCYNYIFLLLNFFTCSLIYM